MHDLDTFKRQQGNGKAPPPDTQKRQLYMMTQAAVSAETLVSDPHWAVYQSYLQEAMDQIDHIVENGMLDLKEPGLTNVERIMWLKSYIHGLEQKKEALKWALELPKDIIANGKEAKALMREEGDAP